MHKLQASTIVFRGKSMAFDPTNFCRCCLTNSESLIPMASTDPSNGNSFQKLYDSLCLITLQLGGEAKICGSCVLDLQMATQFKLMCRQATTKVKEIVLTNLKKRKPNDGLQSVVPEKVQKKDTRHKTQTLSEVFEPVPIKEEPVELTISNQVETSIEPVIVKTEQEPTVEPVAVRTEEELTIVDILQTEYQNDFSHVKTEIEGGLDLDGDVDSTVENDVLIEHSDNNMCDSKSEEEHSTKYVPDSLTCEHCGLLFKNRSNFKDHLQNQGNPCKKSVSPKLVPEFKCEICGRPHRNKRHLQCHVTLSHKTLHSNSYCKFHQIFFPDCEFRCTYKQRQVYQNHLEEIHDKSYKEIYEYVVDHKLQPSLVQLNKIEKRRVKPHKTTNKTEQYKRWTK